MLALPGGADALRLWSAEEPHLYLLLLSLVDSRRGGDGGGGSSASASGNGAVGSGGEEVLEIEACQASWPSCRRCCCRGCGC